MYLSMLSLDHSGNTEGGQYKQSWLEILMMVEEHCHTRFFKATVTTPEYGTWLKHNTCLGGCYSVAESKRGMVVVEE